MAEPPVGPAARPQALVDVLDQVLHTGVVLDGHIVLSVAGVDLVHIGLRALVASVDSAARLLGPPHPLATAPGASPPCAGTLCAGTP